MLADPLNGLVTDLPFVKVSGRLESGVARENDAWGSRGSTSMTHVRIIATAVQNLRGAEGWRERTTSARSRSADCGRARAGRLGWELGGDAWNDKNDDA